MVIGNGDTDMTEGDTFNYEGKLYQFKSYFSYKATATQPNPPKLIAAYRWIKTTQKFSGNSYLVCKASEIEVEQ